MALIRELRGHSPQVADDVFVAETATLIGDVSVGAGSSIWYGAVLRGDVGAIRLGLCCNVQDGAVLHATFNKTTVEIGDNVSIGHNATVHGATLRDNVLVGMGATVLDGAVIESNVIVAANALVLAGTRTEPNCIYAGVPARMVKRLAPDEAAERVGYYASGYVEYAKWYKQGI